MGDVLNATELFLFKKVNFKLGEFDLNKIILEKKKKKIRVRQQPAPQQKTLPRLCCCWGWGRKSSSDLSSKLNPEEGASPAPTTSLGGALQWAPWVSPLIPAPHELI